jgi:predicted RNase H-like HicB family nuclease
MEFNEAKMTNKVVYPIIIEYDRKEKNGNPYFVTIPDLDIFTEGSSIADAMEMAKDAIGTYSLNGTQMPESNYKLPILDENTITTLVDVDIDKYQDAMDMKLEKKTLTIPHKYNELGKRDGVNFSEILTNSLVEIYG